MRLQIDRIDLERLLTNTPRGASIGIDTDTQTITVIDRTGRERGSVHATMEVLADPSSLYTDRAPYSGLRIKDDPRIPQQDRRLP